jgi:drug/metabolite transporter (DMT)-like permease
MAADIGWIAAALGSALVFSCVSINDKIVLSHFRLSPSALSFSIGFGQIIVTAFIFVAVGWPSVPAHVLLRAGAVGILWGGGLLLMFWMLRREEVSRVVPVFHIYPVFVALMAVFLLDEELTWIKWIAVFLAVGGAVLASANPSGGNGRTLLRPMLAFLILAALLVGFAQLILKTIADDLSVWHVLAFRSIGIFIAMSLPLMRPAVVRELWDFVRKWQGTATIIGIDTGGVYAGNILLVLAIRGGPVSLVSAIVGTRPLFVFLLTLLLGWKLSWLLKEELGPAQIALKLASAAMVVSGLALIALI